MERRESYEKDHVCHNRDYPAVVRSDSGAADWGEKKNSSMRGMMQEMMKQKQGSGESMQGMSGMDGMMRMMKMMEQCSAMMESSHSAQEGKESQK
jgi:hypothetical protein